MNIKARILFYNSQTGVGKLILDTKEKLDFSVDVWDDFDVGPESNLLVECEIQEDVLKSIKAFSQDQSVTKNIYKEQEDVHKDDNERDAKYSVSDALKNYFSHIEDVVGDPPEVINTRQQLDYFLSKRFLLTAYNNIRGLDPSLYEKNEIKDKLSIIEDLEKAYSSVNDKLDVPQLAFEMIFLRIQPEYIEYQNKKETYLNKIPTLTNIINTLEPEIKRGEENVKILKNDKVKEELKIKLKKTRGRYVDAIHERACLSEELSEMKDIKAIYTKKYYHDFERELSILKVKYKDMISGILNYKAYDLDVSIWKNASKSRMIQEFFKDAGIKGGYSTKTFLHYYLETLDKSKIKDEQEELFKLLEYLEKTNL